VLIRVLRRWEIENLIRRARTSYSGPAGPFQLAQEIDE
jgi:hypothetical protein